MFLNFIKQYHYFFYMWETSRYIFSLQVDSGENSHKWKQNRLRFEVKQIK